MNKFTRNDFVRKTKGSKWQGRIVGQYSTELTPEGYCVESSTEVGSVQIYPASALELVPGNTNCQPPALTVTVDKAALGAVLQALVNHPHRIRELQATREPVELFGDNPINVLIGNYEAGVDELATLREAFNTKCRTDAADEAQAVALQQVLFSGYTECRPAYGGLFGWAAEALKAAGAEALKAAASEKTRAELYDEVWQQAKDMGHGNVTDALSSVSKLQNMLTRVTNELDAANSCLRDQIDSDMAEPEAEGYLCDSTDELINEARKLLGGVN